jgi:hypothetical protein
MKTKNFNPRHAISRHLELLQKQVSACSASTEMIAPALLEI